MVRREILYEGIKRSHERREVREPGSQKRMLISFIVSLLLFSICLLLIRTITREEDKAEVLVTVKEVPANSRITEQNYAEYFALKEIPLSLMPDKAAVSAAEIVGAFTAGKMVRNQIISCEDVVWKKNVVSEMDNPVEAAVGVSHIAHMVGGTLREGDTINISCVKEIEAGDYQSRRYINEVIAEGIYVSDAFTGAGARIPSEDRETSAVVINILLPAESEAQFNAAMADGTLRISRLCR